jgi:hypothetical protein
MTVFPKLTPIALSAALPGTLIIHEKKIGFVVQDDAPENDGNYIAAYDPIRKQFGVGYSQGGLVLAIDAGTGVVIELDILGGLELGSYREPAASSLLTQGPDAYFILPQNPPFLSYVDIKSGKAKTKLAGRVASSTKWKLGIRSDVDQKMRWLIQVEPGSGGNP